MGKLLRIFSLILVYSHSLKKSSLKRLNKIYLEMKWNEMKGVLWSIRWLHDETTITAGYFNSCSTWTKLEEWRNKKNSSFI